MGFYRSLRRKGETWNSLSKSDRGLLLSAACLLPIVAASLKTVVTEDLGQGGSIPLRLRYVQVCGF